MSKNYLEEYVELGKQRENALKTAFCESVTSKLADTIACIEAVKDSFKQNQNAFLEEILLNGELDESGVLTIERKSLWGILKVNLDSGSYLPSCMDNVPSGNLWLDILGFSNVEENAEKISFKF